VQVNGKTRAQVALPTDVTEAEAVAAVRLVENVARYVDGMTVKKVIFVPGRLVSFVVAG
jgi:leucyl-tRNA synthetase